MSMVCCVSVILDAHILVNSVAPIIRSAIGKGPVYQKNIGYKSADPSGYSASAFCIFDNSAMPNSSLEGCYLSKLTK